MLIYIFENIFSTSNHSINFKFIDTCQNVKCVTIKDYISSLQQCVCMCVCVSAHALGKVRR